MNVFFICDIFITFLTPVIDERGYIKTDFKSIFHNYLQGWLLIDILASVPLEFALNIVGTFTKEQL